MNLLIAMGDSWTAGVGCYPDTVLERLDRKEISKAQAYPLSLDSFAEHNWAKQLTNKLGWDLINLAEGGCSNSGQAKILFDTVSDELCKKYDNIFVIWLLSSSHRLSFYVNNKVRSYHANEKMYKMVQKISGRTDNDAQLETNFYIKCVEKFCKSNNYQFLFGNAHVEAHTLNDHKSNMHKNLKYPTFNRYVPDNMYAYCGHPTTQGYTIIMSEIYNLITSEVY